MAPALTDSPREPHEEPEQHRRRALASVDNITHMEEDDMGLQNHPTLAKDSQEMEQILVDLETSDLAQADLLQAIKTLESGGDTLSTGDTDAIFPLSGFDLPETIESEGDATEDKIRTMQARLERRCAFLERRLRILQARAIGKRVSEEVAQTYEKCLRGSRKDGAGRTCGLKGLLKRIETIAALQASAAARAVQGPKYLQAGTSSSDPSKHASIGITSGTLAGLDDTAGALRSHLSVVKHELDSDATLSSSGAESNDEAVVYNNPHQTPMPIEKRALWSWQRARASIASRWCWLQAQVQELDYKIRQHTDLHRQVRAAKGAVEFEGSPAAYEGRLPGADAAPEADGCARARPLRRDTFKKRKLLQLHNLHIASSKAAKPSDIACNCVYPLQSCAVCTGRAVPTEPLPPASTLSAAQRVALLDPGYHPVLSDTRDVSPAIHLASHCGRPWLTRGRVWRAPPHAPAQRPAPPPPRAAAPAPAPSTAPEPAPAPAAAPRSRDAADRHHRPRRLKRGRPPLSRKIRERERYDDHERPRPRASTESRHARLNSSYDIDNIVIPQSVAANTRPEILHYKEIITPKWRVMEVPDAPLNNGVSKMSYRHSMSESEDEDISEAAVRARHLRSEASERGRYLRKQRTRRSQRDSGADLADGRAAPPLPPLQEEDPIEHEARYLRQQRTRRSQRNSSADTTDGVAVPPPLLQEEEPVEHETVRPYTPRLFPLMEDTYVDMLAVMPDGHRPMSPDETLSPLPADDDMDSSLSPMSPSAFDGDDPDDLEWDPNRDNERKSERRKSHAYR